MADHQRVRCGTCVWSWAISFTPPPVRTTEFAPAHLWAKDQQALSPAPAQGYGPAVEALPRTRWPLLGSRFCPPTRWHAPLPGWAVLACPRTAQRGRREPARGVCGQHSQLPPLPVAGAVSMAGLRHQETAPGERAAASPGRRGCSSAASRDWSRRQPRRACLQLHSQRLEVQMEPGSSASPPLSPAPLSRAQRAHYRLGWQERFARPRACPNS